MPRRLHRAVLRASALLLVAALLVPLALGGHRHADHAARPCAVCVATQHMPVVTARSAAPAPPLLAAVALHVPAVVPLVSRRTPLHAGRAPPLPLALHAA